MKYSDEQRIHKIYENAVRLYQYIAENKIEKKEYSAAMACYNSVI